MKQFYGIHIDEIRIINRLFLRQSFLIYSGEEKIIFKKYPAIYDETQLNNIWNFSSYLGKYGMTSMKLIPQLDGSRFYKEVNNYYVAYEFIAGEKAEKEASYQIGELLRKFHVLSKQITYRKMKQFEKMRICEKAYLNLQLFENFFIDDPLIFKIVSNMDELLTAVSQYTIRDQMIIHGDFTLNNIICKNKEHCIIDFDTIRLGNALEDMVCFILSLCYSTQKSSTPDFERIANFIKGYYKNGRVPKTIVSDLVSTIKVHCAFELSEYAANYLIVKRYPGTDEYLNMLIDAIISDGYGIKKLEEYL